jgi:glycosyltransferase involved in cell wall biosynthesis
MTARRLRLGALVPYPEGTTPSQRYRIEQWAPELAERGIDVGLIPFADRELLACLHRSGHLASKAFRGGRAFLRAARRVGDTRRYDAILIHRSASIFGPAILERAVASLGRPVIFDFDDAIFRLHTTAANRWLGWLKFPGKTRAICRLSRSVVVGNEFLAEFARGHNANVRIIPSSVDTDRFRPREGRPAAGPVVVGWTGSSTSQTYLEMFAPVLRAIAERRDVVVRVHSDREPVLDRVPFEWRRWSPETEAAEIAAFDIGIMPMPHDEWANGKCSMKALLYMAAGVATVCEAVGNNRQVIAHGENGLLAATPEEWVASVSRLVDDPRLRERLGRAGRQTVVERYSKERCAAMFAEVVRESVGG